MKLNKSDMHNLGCLKLAEMGVWTDDQCLSNMNWGRRTRKRTQERYLKRLIEKLADINMKHPGLIEELFEYSGTEKLKEIAEKNNLHVVDETTKEESHD